MKSTLFLLLISIIFCNANAQTFETSKASGATDSLKGLVVRSQNDFLSKKWSIHKYQGLSTSFTGWKGGFATAVSAPIGMQLNRRINNNMYAFAGVSVAPTYISLRQSFLNTDFSKDAPANSIFQSNSAGLFPRAEVGLSFINDARTFQISGSMSIQRTNGNYFGAFPPANNNLRWNGGYAFPNSNPY